MLIGGIIYHDYRPPTNDQRSLDEQQEVRQPVLETKLTRFSAGATPEVVEIDR